MTLRLTKSDTKMIEGKSGGAAQLAMKVIVKLAGIVNASSLINIKQVHIDACTFLTDSGIEFVEKLVTMGGKVKVPSHTNPLPLNLTNTDVAIAGPQYISKVERVKNAYLALGVIPTWTCAPYQEVKLPMLGDQIAWGESNAIAYINSVIGARTERYPDYFDICAALTGRVPYFGLHKRENRKGSILFSLDNIPNEILETDTFFAALGYLVGKESRSLIPVIDGIKQATCNQLKIFSAAAASAGSVGLFHMIGITPEAQTLIKAFQGEKPQKTVIVNESILQKSIDELSHNSNDNEIDGILIGCPHASLQEIEEIDRLLATTNFSSKFSKYFFIQISPQTEKLITANGFKERFLRKGGRLLVGTCLFHLPYLKAECSHYVTSSGKFAYYAPGELNANISFGSIKQCVQIALGERVHL